MILRELSKEDLHRPLRAKQVVGALLFLASFGVVGGALMAIPVPWLRIVGAFVAVALLPFYVRAMVRLFREAR